MAASCKEARQIGDGRPGKSEFQSSVLARCAPFCDGGAVRRLIACRQRHIHVVLRLRGGIGNCEEKKKSRCRGACDEPTLLLDE